MSDLSKTCCTQISMSLFLTILGTLRLVHSVAKSQEGTLIYAECDLAQ
jgi:hypothetical protein